MGKLARRSGLGRAQNDPEALLDVLLRPPWRSDAAEQPASAPFDPNLFDTWLEELYDPASRRFLNASHLGGTGKRWQPLSLIYLLDHPAWRARLPGLYAALLEDREDPVDGGFFFFADPDPAFAPQGGLWERLPARARQPWKTAASQGLYAHLVGALPQALVQPVHRRWADEALGRLPAPTEPDDVALAMLALRRLSSGAGRLNKRPRPATGRLTDPERHPM